MFQRNYKLAAVAALLLTAAAYPAFAADIVLPGGGTLAQIVDGGGTYSIISLINTDTVSIPYTLNFYGDNGLPLALSTTAGSGSVLSGVIPVGGSTIIKTNGTGSAILQGYAVVTAFSPSCPVFTLCQIAGSVVFGLPLSTQVNEASVSLDTGFDHIFAIPFDQTTSNVGVAIANSVGDAFVQPAHIGETASLKFSFFDQTGSNFFNGQMTLGAGQHTAFVLATQFQQVQGKTGVMVVQATNPSGQNYYVKEVGFRVNLAGTTYTSITPVIPCNLSISTGLCTN
jgi:hypothetical protein